LSRPKKSFSPEFKDEAVKMVIETSRPIARVAKELGINEGTLGNWVGIYRRELKMELEFMKKAAAYFARDHR
jgi:transposase-like protein